MIECASGWDLRPPISDVTDHLVSTAQWSSLAQAAIIRRHQCVLCFPAVTDSYLVGRLATAADKKPNAATMSGRRRRRRPDIVPALGPDNIGPTSETAPRHCPSVGPTQVVSAGPPIKLIYSVAKPEYYLIIEWLSRQRLSKVCI